MHTAMKYKIHFTSQTCVQYCHSVLSLRYTECIHFLFFSVWSPSYMLSHVLIPCFKFTPTCMALFQIGKYFCHFHGNNFHKHSSMFNLPAILFAVFKLIALCPIVFGYIVSILRNTCLCCAVTIL